MTKHPSQDTSQNTDDPSSTQTAGNVDQTLLLVEQDQPDDDNPTTETAEG